MFNLSGKANEADAPTAQPQLAETEAKLADALAINEKFHDVSAEVEQTKQALCAAEEGRSIEILPVVGKLDLPEAGSSQHPRKQGRIDMNRRTVLRSIVGAAAFCPTCLSVASAFAGETAATTDHASGPPHWSYGGAEGPEHWGELSPAYRVCDLGVQQSPIDLTSSVPASLGGLNVDYRPTTANVVNNGHTIQVNCDPGSSLNLDGVNFKLLQYHFHHPSEHLLSGRSFDLEAHFVHASADGTLAVLGVFVKPGAESAALAPVWSAMPDQPGNARGDVVQPADLLPADRSYFRYLGSLATPPCSQKVIWSVFRNPVEMSPDQVRQFASLFPMNARPVQRLNRRMLLTASAGI